eukprot:g14588.t1
MQQASSWDRPLNHVAVTVDQVWDVRALSLKTQNIHPYVELFVGNRQYETEVVEHVRCVSGWGDREHQQTSGSGAPARTPRSASLVARLFSPFSAGPFSPNHSGNQHQVNTAAAKGVVEEVSERVAGLVGGRADVGSGLLPRSLPAKVGQRFVVGYLPRHEPGLSDRRHTQAPLEISIVLRDAAGDEQDTRTLGRGHYVVQLPPPTASRRGGTCVDLALSSCDVGGASGGGFVAATYEGALVGGQPPPQDVQGLSERVADMSVVTGFVRLFVESLDQPPGERTATAATPPNTLRNRKEAFWDRVEQDDYGPVLGARGLTMSSGFARGLEERERRVDQISPPVGQISPPVGGFHQHPGALPPEGGVPVHGERISSCAALKPGLRIRSDADGVGTVLGWVGEDGVLVAGLTNDPEVELGQLLPGYVYGPSMRDMLRWRSSIWSVGSKSTWREEVAGGGYQSCFIMGEQGVMGARKAFDRSRMSRNALDGLLDGAISEHRMSR